jgi:hypothetical protein
MAGLKLLLIISTSLFFWEAALAQDQYNQANVSVSPSGNINVGIQQPGNKVNYQNSINNSYKAVAPVQTKRATTPIVKAQPSQQPAPVVRSQTAPQRPVQAVARPSEDYYPTQDNPIIPKMVQAPAGGTRTVVKPTPTPIPTPVPKVVAKVQKPKPLVKKVETYPHFSLYVTTNPFTNLSLTGAELEYRDAQLGLGIFYYGVRVSGWEDSIELKGSTMGAIVHYRFNPLNESLSQKKFDPGMFLSLGLIKLSSSYQGDLPSYIASSFGFDCSYPILIKPVQLSLYGKMGADYIYHSSSGLVYLSSDMSIGLKLSF